MTSPKPMSPETAKTLLDTGQAVLLDVREPAEYKAEHIKGSYPLPLGTCCVDKIPDVDGKKIIIHCKAGTRGEKACTTLLGEDSTLDIYNLKGGLDAWATAGLPTEKSKTLPLSRQVLAVAGGLVAIFTVGGFFLHPLFHSLAGLMGLGLLNAGLTGWCGMAMLLAKMPWNRG